MTPIIIVPNDEIFNSSMNNRPTIWRVYGRKKKREDKDTVKGTA